MGKTLRIAATWLPLASSAFFQTSDQPEIATSLARSA